MVVVESVGTRQQLGKCRREVAQATGRSVEFPNDESDTGAKNFQITEKGRAFVVAPDSPSSLKMFLQPARFKTARCRAGVWSSVDMRAYSHISCVDFETDF